VRVSFRTNPTLLCQTTPPCDQEEPGKTLPSVKLENPKLPGFGTVPRGLKLEGSNLKQRPDLLAKDHWLPIVNQPQTEAEVEALRCCVNRGRPFGDPNSVKDTAERLGLEWTIRPRGRPKKQS